MPIIKPISGHNGCTNVRRYLTRKNRALTCDYLNLDAPGSATERDSLVGFDWAAAMDATRHGAGNDKPWRGKRVRTYKHYIFSPNPGDTISLDALRKLTLAWAQENFADYEVAIVYHDDNDNHIPHAHVVVNNTNVVTGKRLQDPDPRALKRSAQRLAKEAGLHYLKDAPTKDRFGNVRKTPPPKTMQQTYLRRAETELVAKGQYSWVADIRNRVAIARSVATNQTEFESVLTSLGVGIAENSPKAARRDWIYSLDSHPTWRISGERLGLSYGHEAVVARVDGSGFHLDSASERTVVSIARQAFAVGDLAELHTLATMVEVNEREGIRCVADYDHARARLLRKPQSPARDRQLATVVRAKEIAVASGILPQQVEAPGSSEAGRIRRIAQPASGRIRRSEREDARQIERETQQPTHEKEKRDREPR